MEGELLDLWLECELVNHIRLLVVVGCEDDKVGDALEHLLGPVLVRLHLGRVVHLLVRLARVQESVLLEGECDDELVVSELEVCVSVLLEVGAVDLSSSDADAVPVGSLGLESHLVEDELGLFPLLHGRVRLDLQVRQQVGRPVEVVLGRDRLLLGILGLLLRRLGRRRRHG